jgi:hypothetical protein
MSTLHRVRRWSCVLLASLGVAACAQPEEDLSAGANQSSALQAPDPEPSKGNAVKSANCEVLPFEQLFSDPDRILSWGWSVAEVVVSADRGQTERRLAGLGDQGEGALLQELAYDVEVQDAVLGGRVEKLDSKARVTVRARTGSLDKAGAVSWKPQQEAWDGRFGREGLAAGKRLLVVFIPDVVSPGDYQILAAFPVGTGRGLAAAAFGFKAGTPMSEVLTGFRAARAKQ